MAGIAITSLVPQSSLMTIVHPVTGEDEFELADGTIVTGQLELVGEYTDQYIDAAKFMAEQFQVLADDIKNGKQLDSIKRLKIEMLSSCIVGWTNNGFFSTEYSKEEAIDLMSNPNYVWLLDQVQTYILDKSNFFLTN